ncbi:hypothetical protein NM208_g10047 [Fusarium decemcellulare]|uniref:Uncharacterized protein n=1 Tax=Fusarium decemcellulare TaxID=57161 RepID=A0ACC1RZB5_9HYPO|nr:hypothetical protein NM208_g10047 [Fusarium decemcellulare]
MGIVWRFSALQTNGLVVAKLSEIASMALYRKVERNNTALVQVIAGEQRLDQFKVAAAIFITHTTRMEMMHHSFDLASLKRLNQRANMTTHDIP